MTAPSAASSTLYWDMAASAMQRWPDRPRVAPVSWPIGVHERGVECAIMRILVIAPHPDDEVLGCGGTIARYAAAGGEVYIAIITKGWAPLFPAAQVAQVRSEARAAAELLGATQVHFVDLPVTQLHLMPEHELNAAIGKLFADVRPTWALLPFRSDLHEDHKQIFDACMVACRPLPSQANLVRILCYETLSETHWHAPGIEPAFTPHVYIDISTTLTKKLEAMQCYASQVRPAPNARSLESIEALARFRGMTVGYSAAEAFVVVRELMPLP